MFMSLGSGEDGIIELYSMDSMLLRLFLSLSFTEGSSEYISNT